MTVFDEQPPIINKKKLIFWLKTNYSFLSCKTIKLNELNSERDKNYLITTNNNHKYVVKISNSAEKLEFLKYQDQLINHLSKNKNIKKIIPKIYHRKIKIYIYKNKSFYVRILSFIEGNMYAKSKINHSIEKSLGSSLGHVSLQLQTFIHKSAIRVFEWDPSKIDWIKKHIKLFYGNKKNIIQNVINEYQLYVKSNLKYLRFSITHSDPNNYNLVIKNNQITGLIDYGDSLYAPTINDLAISLSYALMDNKNLYSTLSNIISSYHKVFPISDREIYSLMSLCKSRLLITVVMAKKQSLKYPNNKYLSISEEHAWQLLEKLSKIKPNFLIYIIRDICKYPIIINHNKIINFLKYKNFSSIFNFDLTSVNKSIIYLNSRKYSINNNFDKKLFKENSKIAIGLYSEIRNVYNGKNFISLLDNKKRRNIHLGIDIFIKKGIPIYAPMNGKIVILENNNIKYDYGPTLVLEHFENNIKFYTLYGHLSKKMLKNFKIGQRIKSGQLIGKIGSYKENGNWLPHLHFQIILDLMGNNKNFPGVGEDFLSDIWLTISPDPNLILKLPTTFFHRKSKLQEILKKRKKYIPNNYSIAYKNPLHFLESKDQYFFDHYGKKYLDCVNNISHIGHSHPKIQESIIEQNKKMNTNTRYLYEIINTYSENLLNKFPSKLNKVFFVCTGSEANDLAYRIAKAYTNAKDVIVIDNAYHGHTNSLIDISPYKFNGKGGLGKKDHVHVLDMPDPIRGKWKYKDVNWTNKYIKDALDKIDKIKNNRKIACFFTESILGCGGQIILPKNYLKKIFSKIRQINSLCIADEIQTGFGRVGKNFWAFQDESVIPDIVTLGKPMGNGHPMAAVITTKKIASAFDNGMEYFNSFGGNPVSCAIGNTVLEVIEKEKLQQKAYIVGNHLLKSLKKIQNKYSSLISEVRGRGMFIGIDLIKNKDHVPNKKLANKLINYMRNRGILLSIDGPYENVIKIKPPLKFNIEDSDFLSYELNNFFDQY
ncbi:MAG: 5-aminovalerate aminotransferase DavT [Alphaproteobacteria bacterium MarineAlpha5_Bin9]|nr:MAG: 5-aminovalerate aminotransferase DavT [Alphaproteobacteria bacterium MarineAlpha5_Bin9]|tara:strand:+ start:12687 stop:15665 length:2979 start_codon:yes stop_codon:yes gene_type:complete